jgi:hypothetical protein
VRCSEDYVAVTELKTEGCVPAGSKLCVSV